MEKIVCLSEYRYYKNRTFRLLSRYKRQLLNLEFYGFVIDRKSSLFWKKNGYKVRSLLFTNCSFSKKTAKSIIKYCNRIVELSVKNCHGIFSCNVLDICSKKRISTVTLRELNIMSNCEMNDHVFSRLLTVYPNIKKIAVCLVNDRHYNTIYKDEYFEQDVKSSQPDYDSKKLFSHSAVYKYLKLSSLIEELIYEEVDKDTCQMHSNLINSLQHAPNLKLKKFNFTPSSFSTVPELALKMFFTVQSSLECIVLKGINFSSQSFSYLLDNCPQLKSLELEDLKSSKNMINLEPMYIDYEIFEKLISSNLRIVRLYFDFRFKEKEYVHSHRVNKKLEELSIVSKSLLKKDILLFLKIFCNLSHLNLTNCNVDDAVLQIILKYQVSTKLFHL